MPNLQNYSPTGGVTKKEAWYSGILRFNLFQESPLKKEIKQRLYIILITNYNSQVNLPSQSYQKIETGKQVISRRHKLFKPVCMRPRIGIGKTRITCK